MAQPISVCLSELRGAVDARTVAPIVETFLSAWGVDTYQFHDTRAPLSRSCLIGRPDPSLTSVVERGHVWRYDPLHLRVRSDPIVWNAGGELLSASAEAERLFWAPVSRAGYKQAVLVPIHRPMGDSRALTVLIRDRVKSARKSDNLVNELILLTYYLNRMFRDNCLTHQEYNITERECDCLRWTAMGKTAWEIGQILGISERTANFHLQNAMRKMGTPSKYQAALEALRLGIIAPLLETVA